MQLVGEENRRLRISETTYSANTDNTGSDVNGFGLGLASPNKITAVSFTLAMTKNSVLSCGENLGLGWAGAGFFGDFFNPAGAPYTGAIGDIAAGVSVGRLSVDAPGSLFVSVSVDRCDDRTCDNRNNLSAQTLGAVQMGSTNTLSVTWDRPNHQFIFQLNNGAPVPFAYTVSDTFPPGLAEKSFWVAGNVPRCTTTPRPSASIDALFDNVYVNR